jgi:outer membrane lipoprotein-sorting protein
MNTKTAVGLLLSSALLLGALPFAPARAAAAESLAPALGEASVTPLAEGPKTLDGLLDAFRKSPGVSARFTEEKHIALLKKPLKSEGALYFMAPEKLARHVEAPKRSVILLEGNDLRISDGKGVRTVDLAKNAAVAALVRSFVHLLRGDRAVLERDFKVDFSDGGGTWLLKLTPKTAPLSNLVTAISVTGQGLVLSEMTVAEPNGDSTVTHFSEVNTGRRFTEAEKKQLFSL